MMVDGVVGSKIGPMEQCDDAEQFMVELTRRLVSGIFLKFSHVTGH